MRFFYGTAATLQCRLTSVRVRGFRMIAVARRNCPVKPRGSTAVTRTRHYCAAKRHTRLAPATNLATPTTRKNLQARSAGKCKSPQRIYANADFCIGEECEAFANSTQCHCGGTAIPKEKMRRYSNAPPVAELPADRKKFCKRRKSGVESNRGPRAKSLILAGANSMQRTAATVIFFCVRTLPHKCGVWRCYSNAPPVAELPLGSFLATQCSAPLPR